jgi:hypothetical protein
VKSSEVDMGRYNIDEVDLVEDDQIPGGDNRQFAKGDVDQPKRSPIRRKDKLRQEEEMKPKAKRNQKKIQHRLKSDWQGE